MRKKASINMMYCYDAMYPNLSDQSIDPTEYPYIMVIASHDADSTEMVVNPVKVKKEDSFYFRPHNFSPTTFSLMNITSQKSKHDIIPLNEVDPKIFKKLNSSFKRGDEVCDTFYLNFQDVTLLSKDIYVVREHINSLGIERKEKFIYSPRANGIDLDDKNYRIRSLDGSATAVGARYLDNNSVIVFDPDHHYDYMFDKRFEKRVLKDIKHDVLRVTDVFQHIDHTDLNSATKYKTRKFFAHVMVFKKRSSMEEYGYYFTKKCNRDCHFGMHSSVDDPVNNRVRRLKSLTEDLNIETGTVSNKSKSYEVLFDWEYVASEDLFDDIIREIDAGTFYTDKKIGKNVESLMSIPIYIDEEKFINKMKLQTKWKQCIETLIVNNEL